MTDHTFNMCNTNVCNGKGDGHGEWHQLFFIFYSSNTHWSVVCSSSIDLATLSYICMTAIRIMIIIIIRIFEYSLYIIFAQKSMANPMKTYIYSYDTYTNKNSGTNKK